MPDMANKPLLFTIVAIIGLISLAISSTIPASAPGEEMGVIDDGASDAPADAAVEAAAPKAASMDEQLLATWVQAARGGEDGKTRCDDAELMTTLNAGDTVSIEFYRNGKTDYTLWYDTALKPGDTPLVKAAYNEGTWNLEGNRLNEHWTGGTTGLFGSDLGVGEDHFEISINGNVMILSQNGGTVRYVRCL